MDMKVVDVDTFHDKGWERGCWDEPRGEARHDTGESNGGLEAARAGRRGPEKNKKR